MSNDDNLILKELDIIHSVSTWKINKTSSYIISHQLKVHDSKNVSFSFLFELKKMYFFKLQITNF